MKATQQYLEQILNINHQVFLASIVFGQQNSSNFLTATPEEKRAIIQNFLSVGDLFKKRSTIKSLKSGYLADKKINLTLHNDGSSKIEKLDKKIKKLRKLKKQSNYFPVYLY